MQYVIVETLTMQYVIVETLTFHNYSIREGR